MSATHSGLKGQVSWLHFSLYKRVGAMKKEAAYSSETSQKKAVLYIKMFVCLIIIMS